MKGVSTRLSIIIIASAMAVSCAVGGHGNSGGEVTGVGGVSWSEPTPYGMVLVDRGSIMAGAAGGDRARDPVSFSQHPAPRAGGKTACRLLL